MWDQRLIKAALSLFPVLSLKVCTAAVTGTAGCAGTTRQQEPSPPRSVRTFSATLNRQVRPNYRHLQTGDKDNIFYFFSHHHSVIWRCCSCLDRRKFTGTSWWMTAVAVWCNKYVVMKKKSQLGGSGQIFGFSKCCQLSESRVEHLTSAAAQR